MENQLKLKIKIGQVEFEAEGDAKAVTEQRDVFIQNIVPAATSFLDKIQNIETTKLIETSSNSQIQQKNETEFLSSTFDNTNDWSRTSISSFLNKYGDLSDRDFVLFAAFYNEKRNQGNKYSFTVEDVKKYYSEARRTAYSNNSQLLNMLAKVGLIIDDPDAETTSPKTYILSQDGLKYVESYIPKTKSEKKVKKLTAPKRKIQSSYASLTADDLNLSKYPKIKDLKSSKEQIILAMYIITIENKGLWFKNSDIEYIMPNLFDVHITRDQVTNVFRIKTWYENQKSEDDPKCYTHRLLSQAKDFAEKLIKENSSK